MTSSIMTACRGVCRKSIGNGVNIFVHFSSTPISILNLTMSPESQESDVSNDILTEQKYSQLFTHESNIFLLKQLYQANRFTDAVQRWRHSLFIDCSQTDGNASKTWSLPVSLRSLGGYKYKKPLKTYCLDLIFVQKHYFIHSIFWATSRCTSYLRLSRLMCCTKCE